MESSNTPDLATEPASLEAASPNEVVHADNPENPGTPEPAGETEKPELPEKELTLQEKILARKEAGSEKAEKAAHATPEKTAPGIVSPNAPAEPAKPAFEPNYKYKAFGKEKELPETFRSLIKDPESEKAVKEVFTRADAFDDMKSRYESASYEHQKVLQQHVALDKDVRRITNFLNKGDLDNFFASVRVTDEQLLQHLQRKAEIARLSPQQQQVYQEATQMRMQSYDHQEQMNQMQANFTNQAVQARTMQLDQALNLPQVSAAANSWDSKMGPGAFRNLVAETAAAHWHSTKQDLSAAEATQMVLNKYGKLLEAPAAPQAPVVPTQAMPPQAAQPVAAGAKPVIPAVQGRGASPIKQAPKSLADLRKIGKKLQMQEMNPDLDT